MNFDITCNYIEDFHKGFGGVDLLVMLYINQLHTFWCFGYITVDILVSFMINVCSM